MRAVFVGYQEGFNGFAFPLFNVEDKGNPLDGSTVSTKTLTRLGIRDIFDKEGNRLLGVPLPKGK